MSVSSSRQKMIKNWAKSTGNLIFTECRQHSSRTLLYHRRLLAQITCRRPESEVAFIVFQRSLSPKMFDCRLATYAFATRRGDGLEQTKSLGTLCTHLPQESSRRRTALKAHLQTWCLGSYRMLVTNFQAFRTRSKRKLASRF